MNDRAYNQSIFTSAYSYCNMHTYAGLLAIAMSVFFTFLPSLPNTKLIEAEFDQIMIMR